MESAQRTLRPFSLRSDAAIATGELAFHAATRAVDDGWATAGGRVLAVVGQGLDVAAARAHAESGAEAITWPAMQRRNDIGSAQAVAVAAAGGAAR